MRKKAWRRGIVLVSKSEILGSRPGDVAFEIIQFYRRSSTFVKVCRNSSIFIVKFSVGMSKTFFATCVFWSCVTRCGCRTTSSTLFTVQIPHHSKDLRKRVWAVQIFLAIRQSSAGNKRSKPKRFTLCVCGERRRIINSNIV